MPATLCGRPPCGRLVAAMGPSYVGGGLWEAAMPATH
jgi:hypothetical protein